MSERFEFHNPNPQGKNVGDCTVRAISYATNQTWEETYLSLCLQGYLMADMPSSNDVWQAYLISRGWKYHRLQDTCPFCYTVDDFCKEHSKGTFIVATGTHVICVKDGMILDTYDSSGKVPLFYFARS